MNPLISVLHATYRRPEKALETMLLWQERAKNPGSVEYIMVKNENDPSDYKAPATFYSRWHDWKFIVADVTHSPAAWNAAANAASGKLFIQQSDDFECAQDWDALLLERVEANGGLDEPMFLAVSDGYRKGAHGDLCTMAIMTRARRDAEGFFLCPLYDSVFSDDEVTLRALRAHRDGECKFVNARDLVFKHQHHYHVKSPTGAAMVPWDETYQKQNAPEAYTRGLRLFKERNPRAMEDPLRTW